MPDIPQSYLDSAAAMSAAATATGTNRKTLVCLFFFGAIDSHQMLIPTAGVNRDLYRTWRPVPTVGIDETGADGTPFNDIGGGWRLHPGLGSTSVLSGSRSIHGMWTTGRMAIVRNVGVLNKPTTRAQYLADQNIRPVSLFSHNTQQDLWMAGLPPKALRDTGWMGRAANLLDPAFNPSQNIEVSAITTSGTSARLQLLPYGTANIVQVPPSTYPSPTTYGSPSDLANRQLRMYQADSLTVPSQLNPAAPYFQNIPTPNNQMFKAFRDSFLDSVRSQTNTNTNYRTLPTTPIDVSTYFNTTNLPSISGFSNPFRTQFEAAARVIWSRSQTADPRFNQRRQVIFIPVGGWDHHESLRTNFDWRMQALSQAVGVFWKCLEDMTDPVTSQSIADSVVLFTESEFGRTFKANTNNGTDHGWAGHSFVFGSPSTINSGVYGPEPDYTINGGRDAEASLGRYIPDVSIEEYYATLLRWMNIPEAQINLILPNLSAFPNSNIGFLK